MSQTHDISRWAHQHQYGTGNASILVLQQVAHALHCSLAELVGDFTTQSPEWLLIRELLEHRSEPELRRARLALHELLRHAAKAFVEGCHSQHALSLIGAHQRIQRTVHAHQQQGQPSNSLTVGMQHHQSRSPLGAASIKLAHL